jgi:hypothetical protein
MKPFVLKQHEKDNAAFRELRLEEVGEVSGGEVPKLSTVTVHPNGSSDDGSDAG